MDPINKVLASELYSQRAFDAFLKEPARCANFEWRSKPNGPNNPPDFHLIINEDVYSVEVTQTKVMQKDGIEQEKFQAYRKSLVKEVSRIASERGILRGTYHVYFSMRWISPLNIKARKSVVNDLLSYIEETKTKTTDEGINILFNQNKICEILKTKGFKNKAFPSFTEVAWPYSLDNQNTVCKMLSDSIAIKADKLRSVPPPRILLLRNTYAFAEQSIYRKCLEKLGDPSFFHTIFVVMEDLAPNFILYSSNAIWRNEAKGARGPLTIRRSSRSGNGPHRDRR